MGDGFEQLWKGIEAVADAAAKPSVFSIAVLILASVFVLSSLPKMRQPELAAFALADFGITRRVHRRVGFAAGLGELILAATLGGAAVWTSELRSIPLICASLLLWLFAALLVRALLSSKDFACFCFGSGESSISEWTLLRTVALALAATLLAISAARPASSLTGAEIVLQAVTAASVVGAAVLTSRWPVVRVSGHDITRTAEQTS